MRISTVNMYEQSIASMNRQQGELLRVGQQIATGRRVVTPSDDPQASAKAVGISQAIGVIEQYSGARATARNSLSQEESVLSSVSDALSAAKTLMLQGINGTLQNADRLSVATELQAVFETVLGQANAADGNGRFFFGGFNDGAPPFFDDGLGNIVYVGDTNERTQRVDNSRLMSVADSGDQVFLRVTPGSGYVAEADSANTGSVVFKGPGVIDPTDPDYGANFSVAFVDMAGELGVSINGAPPSLYVDGAAITFGGLSLELRGVPEIGDSIDVGPAETMNTDVFQTLNKALAVLRQPVSTEADRAALNNTLNTVMRELDNSLDNVLTVRASVGGRLNELDIIDSVAASRSLGYQTNLSQLVDLDYNEAVADYSLRQVGLQAAQRSFVDINGMSLFDYLR
ncbi:flagellar biosynthesis protein FlgL [Halioglobus sp. HI00S01]|uniref:flagellar hook-associated protein FlgL n=1 Tax=Halioglobus sp. HI00S01 TaxID=1822214 RepID=UPI0007C24C98|nr:flagellar hook-associated protein FlgL [Halioglobus sp. HI00S01]KZX54869.1 flagellar biosynthesis protein FlgL [Halioglobus sp. HI00S01]